MKQDILLMWALGNSLWLPYEFHNRPFKISDFRWHWDDDVAQALMLAETLLQCKWFKPQVFLEKLQWRYTHWYDSLTNHPEGCGIQTRNIIEQTLEDPEFKPRYIDMSWEWLDWNGSLMRIGPAWMINWNIGSEQSAVTHNTDLCNSACSFFVYLMDAACLFKWNEKVLNTAIQDFKEIHWDNAPKSLKALLFDWWYKEDIDRPSWFVIHTLHAVLNTFINTSSPMEWFEYIINLWWDTDTTAAIYWYLAWAYYWIDEECKELIDKIQDVDYIKYLSRKLIMRWEQ